MPKNLSAKNCHFCAGIFLQKLFRKKEIKIQKVPQKIDSKIPAGSLVEIFLPEPRKYFRELTGNSIIFEDKNVIVFSKRAGLTTHAGVGTRGDELRSCAEILLNLKLIVVHRLDRGTSGVIIFAKNSSAARKFENAFRERKVFKKYFAVVSGIPKTASGEINFPLKKVGQKMEIVERGLAAQTFWKVAKQFKNSALLEVEITTGRTHQIRAHLAAINLPVIGDPIYSGRATAGESRMFLHAAELRILEYHFRAEVPSEFSNF